jgi:hypothetical protein
MARKGTQKRKSYEQADDALLAITPSEYGGLQAAFDHFNAALFDKTLPDIPTKSKFAGLLLSRPLRWPRI